MSNRRRLSPFVVAVGVMAGLLSIPFTASAASAAVVVPAGFQEQIVFSGLNQPTNVEFAPDGRIFVAEKPGTIKVFDNLADTTPTLFADLSFNVHELHDRGLFGLAFPPDFPTNPWVYVLYTYDAPPSGIHYPSNDACADANSGTCIVTGRLSRLQASGNVMVPGSEQVLIFDWCQQFASHSIGDLHFGPDGALYVTGGDGASYTNEDHGQFNGNPCGDPAQEGGALRSQDSRSTADPTGLNGTLLRLDPATGAAMPGNPNIGSADPNIRRIIAQGMRNPFRFTMKPGTNEVWIGDVGWNTWEEVNRISSPTAGVPNFGWPCYEGAGRQASYDSANLPLCETLYTAGTATGPYYTYNHSAKVVTGETCPSGSSSISGMAFYPSSGPYPAAYQGALFFADYSRQCIWAMKPSTPGGLPSTSNIETFVTGAFPVDLAIGPGNELYYADIGTGTVRRLRYFPNNQPPIPNIAANPTSGSAPLQVNFNGSGSTDADPADQGRLTYAWDFTNDGTTDATTATTSFAYPAGSFTAKLTVTDTLGASASTTVPISSGNDAPTAFVDTPSASLAWRVGDTITFSGHATDPQQGTLPASALSWSLRMQHCATLTTCHTHFLQTFNGVASGSFVAPDHEYPAYLELVLTATDSQGLTNTVTRRLDPATVDLTFASNPAGLQLVVGSNTATAPFTRTVIIGSTNTLSATTPQTLGGNTYTFSSWSDGGAQTHTIVAPATTATYTASFTALANVNIALNRPATADDECNPSEGPEKAFNGSVSGGRADKWCSQGATKWLQVDLGSVFSIGRFVLKHAGAGGENAILDTRDFNIQSSVDGIIWTTVVTVTGNTADVTTHLVTTSGRYVKLNITRPTGTTDTAARIYEFEVYGQAGPPPPPAVVSGTVTSAAGGTPIAGAIVTVSGTSLTTTTAANGTYTFPDVPTGSRTITASKSGFVTSSTTVTVTSGSTTIANVALNPAPAPAVVTGTVTSSAGGAPLVAATVTVSGTVAHDDDRRRWHIYLP
jgi:glucose/arabinose dehydrogenase